MLGNNKDDLLIVLSRALLCKYFAASRTVGSSEETHQRRDRISQERDPGAQGKVNLHADVSCILWCLCIISMHINSRTSFDMTVINATSDFRQSQLPRKVDDLS